MEKYLMVFLSKKSINQVTIDAGQSLNVIVHQFGFRGGFDSNSHGGQWTTEGCIESCVICEVDDPKSGLNGYVFTIDLCYVNLIKVKQ